MKKKVLFSKHVGQRRPLKESYAQAVQIGDRIVFSSLGGTCFRNGKVITGKDHAAQTKIITDHMRSILIEAGADCDDLVRVNFTMRPGTTRTAQIEIAETFAKAFPGAAYAQRWIEADFPGAPGELLKIDGEAVVTSANPKNKEDK